MTELKQSSLFPELPYSSSTPKPINVASVPQRSPFRYPGGKTWFVPSFRRWISQKYQKPSILIEPFAGGGIISLTALFENLVERVVMAELDDEIAAVWQAVVNGEAEWLANRILSFEMSREAVIKEIGKPRKTLREKAFQTILKNRTFHGGILAEGSGLLKHGENGKGVHSRWYPTTLAKRFRNIGLIAHRIDFRHSDGFQVLRQFSKNKNVVYFIDPPYTAGGKKAGRRLYKHFNIDHERLFEICESLKGDFLITYDNAEEVKTLARRHRFEMRLTSMTNTHHAKMEELIIGGNLSWTNEHPAVHEPKVRYSSKINGSQEKKQVNAKKLHARRKVLDFSLRSV